MAKKYQILMPDYYPEFRCLADKCKYTCCQSWYIAIKKPDYHKLKSIHTTPEIRDAIKNSLKRNRSNPSNSNYAHIQLDENKFCPFFTSDGLCDLQIKCGFPILPFVCKSFPRMEHFNPVEPEHSCSTGCEKVVDMLIQRNEPLRYIKQEDELLTASPIDFAVLMEKKPLLVYYKPIQEICIGILQNRNYSYLQRMILLGLALKDLSEIGKKFNAQDMNDWIYKKTILVDDRDSMTKTLGGITVDPSKALASCIMHCHQFMINFQSYEKDVVQKAFHNLEVSFDYEKDEIYFNIDTFQEKKKMLYKYFPDFENTLENIMVNHFFSAQYPLMHWNVWDDYKLFCFEYSFFNFMCIGYMDGEYKRDDLIHLLTLCSRMIFHNQTTIRLKLINLFKQTGVDSLADMITLIYN